MGLLDDPEHVRLYAQTVPGGVSDGQVFLVTDISPMHSIRGNFTGKSPSAARGKVSQLTYRARAVSADWNGSSHAVSRADRVLFVSGGSGESIVSQTG